MDRDDCFRLAVEQGGNGPVLRLAGDLDVAAAAQLRACLAQYPSHFVTLDFSAVTFMDSTIICVIVGASQQVKAAGGELTLRAVPLTKRHVLDISGVSTVLRIENGDQNGS